MIKLSNFNFSIGELSILTDISLTINAGEKIALIGPSGVGKSTLLKAIANKYVASCSYCPQDNALVDNLSVYNNIYAGRLDQFSLLQNIRNLFYPVAQHWQAISEIAEQLEIGETLKRSPQSLSGGQQKRVAIGRALFQNKVPDKPVFIGDEPFSGLDKELSNRVLDVIENTCQTTIVSLHDRDVALKKFSRIIALNAGKIILDQATEQLDKTLLSGLFGTKQ